ncbi:MAG: hypothetical protein ABFS17_11415 [Chloroflexota bacterium]
MMIESTLPARRAVAEIVYAYRQVMGADGAPLSLREFARALNQALEVFGDSVSHQTIKNWEDRVHLPRTYFMIQIGVQSPNDWRRDFSQDILSALRPDLYQPATAIGRLARERSLAETGPQKPGFDSRWLQS